MATIPLSRGLVALVDDEDLFLVAGKKWHVSSRGYACRHEGRRPTREYVRMHRLILGTPNGVSVDHINGDRLDNRRANLRIATQFQNVGNMRLPSHNTSGFKGVSWDRANKKWRSVIHPLGRQLTLGRFDDSRDAARVYDEAAIKYFGPFARTNQMMGLL